MNYSDELKIFKALADENRLCLLMKLKGKEMCACKLLEECSFTQPTLSHHLKILCDAQLIKARKDGKWMHYTLSVEGEKCLKEFLKKVYD